MDKSRFSRPIDLHDVAVTDEFWHREQELVRTEVIPYQWEALNDRVEGADPSYCMHNFKAAVRQKEREGEQGKQFEAPAYSYRGFNALPEDPKHPDPDKFYGFVFQDTDFSKWIEAVGYSLVNHPDPELERIADGAIDIVCAAQLDNGYLDTYYILNGMDRAFHCLRWHHELYCLGHLIEGAIAYWQGTGKDKLLKAAERFADYVASVFGPEPDQCKGYPGHEIAEMALVRLYEATGKDKYLKLAKFFIDERGTEPNYFDYEGERDRRDNYKDTNWTFDLPYAQAHKPVREQREAVGHAVRAGYLYSGMADVARETADDTLYDACRNLWRNIVDRKLYITGGIGGTHEGEAFSYNYDLPNDTAYSETCAAISLAFFARRMLEIEAKSEYGDVMEQALYNTVLAGMALDGKSFFYVNPLEVNPEACAKDKRIGHVKPVRQKWFGCACCPPNIARIVSSVGEYAFTANDSTLFVHLYAGGSVSASFGTGEAGDDRRQLTLEGTSEIPWGGKASYIVHAGAQAPVHATIAFRIPGWSVPSGIKVSVDGASVSGVAAAELAGAFGAAGKSAEVRDGYLYLTGDWSDGETIAFDFPIPVRAKRANPQVREDVDKVAFVRGPITFCAEQADNGADLQLNRVDFARAGYDMKGVGVRRVDDVFGFPIVELSVPVLRLADDGLTPGEGLYADYAPAVEKAAELTLIPYFTWANRGVGEMTVWIRA